MSSRAVGVSGPTVEISGNVQLLNAKNIVLGEQLVGWCRILCSAAV